MKIKNCTICNNEETTLYRIQVEKGKAWIFVCNNCCKAAKLKEYYKYGGTWKGYRH